MGVWVWIFEKTGKGSQHTQDLCMFCSQKNKQHLTANQVAGYGCHFQGSDYSVAKVGRSGWRLANPAARVRYCRIVSLDPKPCETHLEIET
jgi:hypothetical protein